jgi:voltage-gated potassium channel
VYLLISRFLRVSHRRHAVFLGTAFVVVVLVGGGLFALAENIPFTTGLYWAITTATTVGYGDVIPHNPAGRVIASLVMLTAIPMLGALFAVVAGASISAGVRRIMQRNTNFPDGTYRLVLGTHATVPAILAVLGQADESVVLVADVDPATVPESVHHIRGNPTDPVVISKARPAGAQHALITAGSDGEVLVSAIALRKQAPDLPITALSDTGAVREALVTLGVQQTVSVDDLIAHTLAKSIETPHAGGLIEELIDSDACCLTEFPAEDEALGRPLSEIRRDHGGLVLGIVHDGVVDLGVAGDPTVAPGDRLLIAVALTGHVHRGGAGA